MRRIVAVLSAAAFLLVLTGATGSSAQTVLDCDYFNFQEQAQAILEEDLSDPFFLDDDGDGIACPDLPSAGPDPDFPELPESGDYACVDFPYQEMAQVILEEDASDPYNLDPTGDGLACSRLPLQADYALEDGLDDELATDTDTTAAEDDREARRQARREARQAETDGAAADDAAADDATADDTTAEDDREARREARRAAREAEAAGEE